MKKTLMSCLIGAMVFLASCQTTGDRYANLANSNAAQNIKEATAIQDQKAAEIHTSVDTIQKNVDEIQKESTASKTNIDEIKKPENEATVIEIKNSLDQITKASDTIATESKKIDDAAFGIEGQSKNILQSNSKIVELEKQVQTLKQSNSQAEQEAKKTLYRILGVGFGISLVIILVGAVLMFTGTNKNLGYTIFGIGLLTLALAAGATFYLETIAIIGISIIALGAITALGVLAWKVFRADSEITTLSQANVENVRVVEAVKQELSADKKVEFFGDRAIPGKVNSMQTEKTKKLVAKIRQEVLKPEIQHTIFPGDNK